MTAFESARLGHRLKVIARAVPDATPHGRVVPDMQLSHFLSMCDDTGLFQHAVHSVPDRAHGYCVDDNARALLLACALNEPGERPLPDVLTARFAAFVQHAWNPDTRQFRNFMGFNRTWLEDRGSEDSHGRTLWALGECARKDATLSRRRWASALFAQALPAAETFRSPRTSAFTLLGLDAYCATNPDHRYAQQIRYLLADRLMSALALVETPDWLWFEEGLAYDNARLPQALIVTGVATQTPGYVEAGLRSLRWLMTQQRTSTGPFSTCRHRWFRRTAETASRVRSTARGSHCNNCRLPDRMARGWRCRMEDGCDEGFLLVSRRQRPVGCARRPRDRKLPRWIASRSCQ